MAVFESLRDLWDLADVAGKLLGLGWLTLRALIPEAE